ncbi:hypothetical protein ABZ924_20200 [Streptomyces sp. NPDC046876]|uniref:hypothetical protein n=1 Tax=Streptomyces sp. NPDC046876 TaxID=3155616 RepID=UPI0033D390F9
MDTQATGGICGTVAGRPTPWRIVRIWAAALVPGTRRSSRDGAAATATAPHSQTLRQNLLCLVVMELAAAVPISSMLPPAVRVAHAVLEAVLILAGLGTVAALARAPHEVRGDALVLRTGFLGEVQLPREAVRSVGSTVRTVPGCGPRPVPGEPNAVACSVDGNVNVVLRLAPPVHLDLGPVGRVAAETLYTSAESATALRAALAS